MINLLIKLKNLYATFERSFKIKICVLKRKVYEFLIKEN